MSTYEQVMLFEKKYPGTIAWRVKKHAKVVDEYLNAITPDLYNDTSIYKGLVWGTITIDTVKEVITLSNISKYGIDEIETTISEFMMDEKKKYKEDTD